MLKLIQHGDVGMEVREEQLVYVLTFQHIYIVTNGYWPERDLTLTIYRFTNLFTKFSFTRNGK